jgi:hypothetical protein
VIFVDIGGIVDHQITLSDGQQFHQYKKKTPLTSIH